MNTAILLCAAMLAADHPARVQVKLLFESELRHAHVADIDLWISRAVEKSGSPLVLPRTDWIKLTDDEQRIYTSPEGGFILDGKAVEQNGEYKVEINGCAGFPLKTAPTLKRGERRVINLTKAPAPDNVFIALEAPLSEQATKRAEEMKASVKTFQLYLDYSGQEDKPFYRLTVSVPVVDQLASNPFRRIVQIKEDKAYRIIEHLARCGFLDNAIDLRTKKLGPQAMPGYTMKVVTGNMPLQEDLGWGWPMIQRLDDLCDAMPEMAIKDMEFMLTRLSGLRMQWEAEQQQKSSLKGWELYIWEKGGDAYFSLMVGTNRLKTDEEIAKSAMKGFEAIKPQLDQLKKGEAISLHGRRSSDEVPGKGEEMITEYCEKIGLEIQ